MCGRIFCLFNSAEELISNVEKELEVEIKNTSEFEYSGPLYNICPSTAIPVLNSDLQLKQLNWGFKAGKIFIINARNEEVKKKISFKSLVKNERCVVICSGYYEWHCEKDKTKSPYSFKPENYSVCFLAALRNPKNDSVVLMTREAAPSINHIHNRMPVLLENHYVSKWLNHRIDFDDLKEEIIVNELYQDTLKIEYAALAKFVNSNLNTGPECLQSIKEYKEESFAKGIGKFFKRAKMSMSPKE